MEVLTNKMINGQIANTDEIAKERAKYGCQGFSPNRDSAWVSIEKASVINMLINNPRERLKYSCEERLNFRSSAL